jgi:hypothetical protein
MEERESLRTRWSQYRPSKALWFWSCVGCVVLTMIVGFGWGGWVAGGTAAAMSAGAAQQAKAQFAADFCVSRFDAAPDSAVKLAALKSAESWERADFIDKGGWAKLPWVNREIEGSADLCAQKLMSASVSQSKPATSG